MPDITKVYFIPFSTHQCIKFSLTHKAPVVNPCDHSGKPPSYNKIMTENHEINSHYPPPNHAVLEPILVDLDRLWEMRHWIPEPGKPIVYRT